MSFSFSFGRKLVEFSTLLIIIILHSSSLPYNLIFNTDSSILTFVDFLIIIYLFTSKNILEKTAKAASKSSWLVLYLLTWTPTLYLWILLAKDLLVFLIVFEIFFMQTLAILTSTQERSSLNKGDSTLFFFWVSVLALIFNIITSVFLKNSLPFWDHSLELQSGLIISFNLLFISIALKLGVGVSNFWLHKLYLNLGQRQLSYYLQSYYTQSISAFVVFFLFNFSGMLYLLTPSIILLAITNSWIIITNFKYIKKLSYIIYATSVLNVTLYLLAIILLA